MEIGRWISYLGSRYAGFLSTHLEMFQKMKDRRLREMLPKEMTGPRWFWG